MGVRREELEQDEVKEGLCTKTKQTNKQKNTHKKTHTYIWIREKEEKGNLIGV